MVDCCNSESRVRSVSNSIWCFSISRCYYLLTQFTWRHHQNNLGCAMLVVNVTVRYSVKCALLVTRRLHVNILTTNMASVPPVAAWDARARGQYKPRSQGWSVSPAHGSEAGSITTMQQFAENMNNIILKSIRRV